VGLVSIINTSQSPIACLDDATVDQYVSFILVAFDAEILGESRDLDHQLKSITFQIGDGTIEFADCRINPTFAVHVKLIAEDVIETFERAVWTCHGIMPLL
jgi:hypothetical protein